MARIPDATYTPEGPTYEGRLLDRSDEEVVDQGARFDIQTVITRRGVIGVFGAAVGAAVLSACAPSDSSSRSASGGTSSTTSTSAGSSSTGTSAAESTTSSGGLPSGEIPEETAGPYPGDGSNGPDVLEQSGIVRSDVRSSIGGGATADGVGLQFTLTVLDMANGDVPFEGAAVYAWHCDAQGRYSMYSEGVEDETYLRGVQVADADGNVSFTSIFPGCYAGRWPHIHFEVYPDVDSIDDPQNAIATSQIALPQDSCEATYASAEYDGSADNLSQVSLDSDGIFSSDGGELQLATVSGDPTEGYQATLTVRVDTSTKPGSADSGGAPGGGPGAGSGAQDAGSPPN
ncbi:MAG: intradiol ring-cleavage dioxygenase [Cumulibacter sp.]